MGRRKIVLDEAVSAFTSLGISAVGFEGDVRKQEDARRVVQATVEHFGKLDILVNGKYVNGVVMPVDGGMWLSKLRHLSKDVVRQISRAVEKQSRVAPAGVPATSKL